MRVGRREAVLGAAAIGCSAALVARALADARPRDTGPVSPAPLRVHAARRGMSFGTMVTAPALAAGNGLPELVAREADMVVPGIELKWGATEQRRGAPDYAGAEAIAAFATAHGLALRGHTAFWYRNLPRWAAPLLAAPGGEALALAHIRAELGRWRGRIVEWDVVNEAVEPLDGLPGGLRRAPFGRPVDIGFYADCFHAARDADPGARLYYNDYGLEYAFPAEQARRDSVLALLTELKRRGAPIQGLGLQSHIRVGPRFDAKLYRAWLGEVAALGLQIRLTEFDVGTHYPDLPPEQGDAQIADHARALLDAAFDERAVRGMLCWGLIDRDSYARELAAQEKRTGPPARPLPFDDSLQRKPLWTAIARAYDGAPQR